MTEPLQGGDPVKLTTDQAIVGEKIAKMLAIPAGRAKVTAVHFKKPILDYARARVEVERLDDIEFVEADVSKGFPFPDASFDYLISTVGVNFIPDQEFAASELARILKPGGRLALTAYLRSSMPGRVYEWAQRFFELESVRHPYEWVEGPRIAELLNPNFHAVAMEFDTYDICFVSALTCYETTSRWNVNVANLLSRVSPDKAETVKSTLLEMMESVNRATDGTYLAPVEYGVVTAVRG